MAQTGDAHDPLLAAADVLRVRWVDLAGVTRAKGVYLPTLRREADRSTGGTAVLDRAVRISQAQFAIPVTADAVIAATGLLPTHDLRLVPDWSSLCELPYAAGHVAVAADTYDGEKPWPGCPRGFLRRMGEAAAAAGLDVAMGVELEFVLLDAAEVAAGRLTRADACVFAQEAAFDRHPAAIAAILTALDAQGIPPAQVHPESAGGQWEISLAPTNPLTCADWIVSARQTVHAVAREHGLIATFLPLLGLDAGGSGMHVHMSFTGEPDDGLGRWGEPAIAGILDHLDALLAVTAPTPASLQRFRPHFWVGAYRGWGVDNKEVPLRVVPGRSGAPRDLEFKAIDATANPYLALGALVAAALDGIARGATAPAPVEGDPGSLSDDARAAAGTTALPHDPSATLAAFAADEALRAAMGEMLHRTYLTVKRVEAAELADMGLPAAAVLTLERY